MSGSPLGFVLPAATLGLGALLIRPRRGFFYFEGEALKSIQAQATLEESHTDELEITEHPIEQGAAIADHAFKRPAEVVIRCAWSDSPSGPSDVAGRALNQAVGFAAALAGSTARTVIGAASTVGPALSLLSGNAEGQSKSIYKKLLALQESRVPFDLLTGKRAYRNMLMRSLAVSTDGSAENSLMVVAVCRQVIIVTTQVITVPGIGANQADESKTSPTRDLGTQSLDQVGP